MDFVLATGHICNTCGNSYKYLRNLLDHQRFKCGKEPTLVCPFCSKKCFRKRDLQVHLISCRNRYNISDTEFHKVFQDLFKERR